MKHWKRVGTLFLSLCLSLSLLGGTVLPAGAVRSPAAGLPPAELLSPEDASGAFGEDSGLLRTEPAQPRTDSGSTQGSAGALHTEPAQPRTEPGSTQESAGALHTEAAQPRTEPGSTQESAGALHTEAAPRNPDSDGDLMPQVSDPLGDYTVTRRQDYIAAPGLAETDLIVNSSSGLAQNRIHILSLDPGEDSLSLTVGYRDCDPSCWGFQRTSDQAAAAEARLQAENPKARVVGAVNANFYNMQSGEPVGVLVMDGVLIHESQAGFAYFAVLEDGTAEIREDSVPIGPEVRQAVAGRELLLRDGQVIESEEADLNPRTAVGIRADGSVLIWQSEGRMKPLSEGLTVTELARMLRDLGCVDALNLDGGGSSVLLSARGQEPLSLRSATSDGYERLVASTLLVVSTSTEAVVQPEPHDHDWQLSEDGEAVLCGCGAAVPLSAFTGILTDASGNRYCYLAGVRKSGWITWGDEMLHSNSDGRLHAVTTSDSRGCTVNGKISALCDTCKRSFSGYTLYHPGHRWDENQLCSVCGAAARDIAACTVSKLSAAYVYRTAGQRVTPSPTLTDGDRTLSLKTSSFGEDGFIYWENCNRIGTARVVIEGQGDYRGRLILPYRIVPDKVPNAAFGNISADSVDLSWSSVPGVDSYVVCRYDYPTKTLIPMAETDAGTLSLSLSGLQSNTAYTLCVRGRKTVEGVAYESASYTWLQFRTESYNSDPQGTSLLIDEIRCALTERDAIRDQADRDENRCLFLPAFADLSALPMEFLLKEGESGVLRLSGVLGSREIDPVSTVDLNALCAPEPDGSLRLQVQLDAKKPMELRVYRASVPALFLRSEDPENHGRTWVDASKSNVAAGTAALIRPDGSRVYDGELTQLKARGNTTFRYSPKKAYQIKIKKTDLIGIGEKVKTWVLLAGYTDATQMHDKLLKDLAAELGMSYVPRNDWVDLYYDGEYRGLYLLGEKNDVGSTAVDITDLEAAYEETNPDYGLSPSYIRGKNRFGNEMRWTSDLTDPAELSGGFLLELNHAMYDEPNGFLTSRGKGVNLKSPEYLGKAPLKYISEYYQEFEDAVCNPDHSGLNPETGKHYYEYVDRDSLVRIYLIQELANNVDAFVSSFYFYKDAGEIMYAGPVWDLDSTFGTGWDMRVSPELNFISSEQNGRYLAQALIQIPDFAEAVRACYRESFRPLAVRIIGEGGQIERHRSRIEASAGMNYRIWPFVRCGNPALEDHIWEGMDYPAVLEDLDDWITRRLAVLDGRFPASGPGGDDPLPTPTPTPTPTPPTPTPPTPTPPFRFDDVQNPDRFYYEAVYWAAGQEPPITRGTSETLFSPNRTCTRAQVVTFLWRAAGCPAPTQTEQPFSDVSGRAFYDQAVLWAVEKGITKGVSETRFGPNRPCTRGQVVTFLWRALGCPPPTQTEQPFSDVSGSAFYYQAMLWAVEKGITKGVSETRFGPNGSCTRGQVVTFLRRAFAGE